MKNVIPDAILASHIAILGKTGSGKTSTEKLLVEDVASKGFRVCVLDTIKSDWWGITSSASGKSAGLPFKILGGPRGHVPLHSSAGRVIGELVGKGALPLSIIDMANFEPGGIQRFFVEFAQALWRTARGVVYLVIEEAHEVAPKERAGFGSENMSIHYAKKLASGGRTKGIRLVVATQSVQQLHNRVLGGCETLIAHRLIAPADQEPVVKWVKANESDKKKVATFEASLSSLPTGTGWICSGEAQVFEQVKFPKFSTYDNTSTPVSDAAEVDVKTAPVDQDELRALIGDAVKQAEATDVKALQKKVADLEKQLGARPTETKTVTVADAAAVQKAEERGFERGKKEVAAAADARIKEARLSALEGIGDPIRAYSEWLDNAIKAAKADKSKIADAVAFVPTPQPAAIQKPGIVMVSKSRSAQPTAEGSLDRPLQRIVNSIRWWNVFGLSEPTQHQVAFIADYSPGSGTWSRYLSSLRSAGMIAERGPLVLTDAGREQAQDPDIAPTAEALRAAILGKIDKPLARILTPLLEAYPDAMTHEGCAAAAGFQPGSGTWSRYLSTLRSLDLIEKRGELRAQSWLFP